MINNNKIEENIGISGWGAEQMRDFLNKKLKKN